MDGGGYSVDRCFPGKEYYRQGEPWIVEDLALAAASSGSESRQEGANAGAVSALVGPG